MDGAKANRASSINAMSRAHCCSQCTMPKVVRHHPGTEPFAISDQTTSHHVGGTLGFSSGCCPAPDESSASCCHDAILYLPVADLDHLLLPTIDYCCLPGLTSPPRTRADRAPLLGPPRSKDPRSGPTQFNQSIQSINQSINYSSLVIPSVLYSRPRRHY